VEQIGGAGEPGSGLSSTLSFWLERKERKIRLRIHLSKNDQLKHKDRKKEEPRNQILRMARKDWAPGITWCNVLLTKRAKLEQWN